MFYLKEFKSEEVKLKFNISDILNYGNMDIEFYTNKDYIGIINLELEFKSEEFDEDSIEYSYDYNENNPYEWKSISKNKALSILPKLSNYIISIHSFEIEFEQRGNGYGGLAFKEVVKIINNYFKKCIGVYLSVFVNNKSAIKIYKDNKFKVIGSDRMIGEYGPDCKDYYIMKMKIK